MKPTECTLLAAIVTFLIFLGGYSYEWIAARDMALVTLLCGITALVSIIRLCKKGW